jgi:aquaporin Z
VTHQVTAEGTGITGLIAAEFERDVIRPIQDFQNPSQEWRRLFSELLGTFFLVLVAAGGGMMGRRFRTRSVAPPRLSRRG